MPFTHTLNVLMSPVPQCFYGPVGVCQCVCVWGVSKCLPQPNCLSSPVTCAMPWCQNRSERSGLTPAPRICTQTHTQTHTHTQMCIQTQSRRLGARALGGWRLMKGSDWREVAKCSAISVTAKLTKVKTSDTHMHTLWGCTFRLLRCPN